MYLKTDRLIISNLKEEDKEDYFNNISHDKLVLETFICNYCEDINDFDFNKYLNRDDIFAIRLNDSKLIGIITMFDRNDKDNSLEIGYGIGSHYWNKGYTTEAVKAFINYLFENGISKVNASFFKGNIASLRVMKKCGMVYSHTNLEEIEYLGIKRNLIYYTISSK